MQKSISILILVISTLLAANIVTSGQALAMSEEEEIAIGKEAHKAILQTYRVYNNQDLQEYVQYVGDKLAEHSERNHLDYHFLILDSEEVNAFALPGGYIYITRGLMAYLNTEAELAAVLGHEIGHVSARHASKQESASKIADIGKAAAAILGSMYVPGLNPNVSHDLLGVGSEALLKGYGRDHELESDQLGAEYLVRSGYDPQALLDVIATLKDQESYEFKLARLEGRKPRVYHGLFASHPDNDTRLQEVIKTADTLSAEVNGPAVTGTITSDSAYLAMTNGLSYGEDARQGILRDQNFYHGPLGYSMRFPKRWEIENHKNTILARTKTDSSLIQVSMMAADPKLSQQDFMLQRMGLKRLSNGQNLNINGLAAHTAMSVINSPYGSRLSRITVIYYGRRAYIITGTSKDAGGIKRFDGEFLKTAKSFRPMSREERKAAGQQRIKVILADETTTYDSLARTSPLYHLAEEQLRLLNGDYPNGVIEPGDMVKIIQ